MKAWRSRPLPERAITDALVEAVRDIRARGADPARGGIPGAALPRAAARAGRAPRGQCAAAACGRRTCRRECGGLGLTLPAFARLSARSWAARRSATTRSAARRPTPATWSCCSRHGTPAQQRALPARRSPRGDDPQLLRDDRARPRRLEPGLAGDDRAAGRRRLRDRRPQVVHLGRRRRGVRDRDGGDRPEAPPHQRASQILVPTDTPGLTRRAQHPRDGPRGRGLLQPRRGRARGLPRAGRRTASARRAPGFALAQERLGPGPHPPLHALDRRRRARARPAVRARVASRELRPGQAARLAAAVVQHWIAESRAEIDAARLLVLRRGRAHRARRARGRARARLAHQVLRRRRAATACSTARIQAHGALGLTDDTAARLLVAPRARRAHLRRPRRGAQVRRSRARC